MNKHIYVVMGACVNYDDRVEWPVCAYNDESMATKHADTAESLAVAYRSSLPSAYAWRGQDFRAALGAWDPISQAFDTSTEYYVVKVPVCEELP